MIIPQTVLDYKQALVRAVQALDWTEYQTTLKDYQEYHSRTSSEPFFLPHSSKLLMLVVVKELTPTKTAAVKTKIIKSLIELGGLTTFNNFGDCDCVRTNLTDLKPGGKLSSINLNLI